MENKEVYHKSKKQLIFGITVGSMLEWYEIFSFAYWGPLLYKVFFPDTNSPLSGITYSIIAFSFGFLSRPIGGLLFGSIGDKKGRKFAFIQSIIWIIAPSIAMGLLPTYAHYGAFSYVLLIILRLIQGFPAGGELPGAMCYLGEVAPKESRRFFCSYTFVGAQIGAIIAIIESLFLEFYISTPTLLHIGWRISFLLGGGIGLIGLFFRKKIDETPLFKHLEHVHHVLKKPLRHAIMTHKREIILGFLFCVLEVVGYFLIGVYPALYFQQIFDIDSINNFVITGIILFFSVLTIPLFGKLGDKLDNRILLIVSSGSIFILCFPFYYSMMNKLVIESIICELLLICALNIQFALIPSLLSSLFPTSTRYSCLGLSFNICDSFLGGGVPLLALYLFALTDNRGSFIWILACAALISLVSFIFAKKSFYIHHDSDG